MASGDDKSSLPRGLIGRRGTPSGKGARLPSIRTPRDLTLGGVPKKVFTPNIPARRDKSKEKPPSEQESASETKKPKRSHDNKPDLQGDRGRGQGRGRGRGQGRRTANVIQSHSIFEQGPAGDKNPRGGSGYSSYDPADRSSSSGPRSSTSIKKEPSDSTVTKEVIDHLLRDDFVSDLKDGDEEMDMMPVKLPLAVKTEVKSEADNYTRVKIKDEPMDEDDQVNAGVAEKSSAIKSQTFKQQSAPTECCDLFSKAGKSVEGQLMFFQLPDVLPGVPPTTAEELENRDKKNTKKEEEDLSKKFSQCCLKDFSEGHVGKLIVRKSGRVQLMLGTTVLDVAMGTPCGFLQDAVAVQVQDGRGDMSVLGHIDHRLVCTPDFQSLLTQS